ncbi:binding--dependent transport system inner membrane component family protein [Mycobacterium ulcerans str. Harvey]|uniref:Binding--dependent transport system inner membrane component family protein n=1 Tax=Mycobacterium ulcerans str. Harvey TaxID=1299332 RepID=A0ABP3AQD7_MYCUL|nr:binding--dependent transport system inner membrane component family protein [Mycobacterium ulcerans str. Harvey]
MCGGDSGGNRIDARTEAALFEADHHRRQFRSGRAGYRPDRAGGGRVRDRSARRDRCPHRLRRDPIIANTVTGLDGVDRRIVEAARGMGLSAFSTLRRVELPLSLPVIVAGVRTALVLIVGTAALASFTGGRGLGQLITTGIKLQQPVTLIVGAILVAALALFIDWLARLIEMVAAPRGL